MGASPRILNGRYILDDDWREGGMARVYRAFDRQDHRTVAVKVLARELHPDERLVNLIFDRELRSLRRLAHPNIVSLLDGGRDPETSEPFFVFEWVDRDLADVLGAQQTRTWDAFCDQFALPILDALAHAHERQVSHRDIKPNNILVTDEGIPKIADFGIAKIEADIQPGLTLADHSTKPYVPPRGELGPSRDVYAYAVLVLTTLAGIDPLADEYLEDRYVAVGEALDRAALPDPVRDLFGSCVSEDPDDRPHTAGQLLSSLNSVLVTLREPERTATYYLSLSKRARSEVLHELALADETEVIPAIEDDLAGGAGLLPLVREGKPEPGKFELFGAELWLRLAVDEATQDRFVVMTAVALQNSLLERRRDRSYRSAFSFKVGEPPNRIAAQNELAELQMAIAEHAGGLRQRDLEDEARRVFWMWKATLNAKQQLEKEREAPLKFTSVSVNGRRATFSLAVPPAADLLGESRFRQVELSEGGYLGGEVFDVRDSEVELAVQYGDASRLPPTGELKVDTRASRAAITRQTAALDLVIYDRALRSDLGNLLMQPERAALPQALAGVEFFQAQLDEPKQRAVRAALGSDDFLVVQGPPGTGKTTFIVELVAQFLTRRPGSRVLVTSQTHAALDNVLERLSELDLGMELVRVGRTDDPRISPGVRELLLEPVIARWRDEVTKGGRKYLRAWASEQGISERDVEIATLFEEAAAVVAEMEVLQLEQAGLTAELEDLRERSSSEGTRNQGATIQQSLDGIDRRLASLDDDLAAAAERLTKLKAIEAKDLDGLTARDLRVRAESAVDRTHPAFERCQTLIKLLGDWHARFGRGDEFYGAALLRAQVVAATCLGLHAFKGADAVEFDLCIVDEASKATATETLVPIVQARRWVLVGDQRQLPPFVEDALLRRDVLTEHELSEADVRETLLDRLVDKLPSECVAMLSTQHRMVPEIGALVSDCFYEGQLVSTNSLRRPWLERVLEKPVVWYTTARHKNRFEVSAGTSRANPLEARAIKHLIERLNFAAHHCDEMLEVAVLSGYLPQVAAIERLIAAERDSWANLRLECSSIDAFQGRECDVLIYSVTRANKQGQLGFLGEERRLNVALSRGREGLVLVGDHVFARTASGLGKSPFRRVVDHIEGHPHSSAIIEVPL